VAGHAQFKFSAFLSYAHADARWGTWLHKRLEGYKLDRELVGRVTPRGPAFYSFAEPHPTAHLLPRKPRPNAPARLIAALVRSLSPVTGSAQRSGNLHLFYETNPNLNCMYKQEGRALPGHQRCLYPP
jgi:hypothetical protein